MRLGVIAATMLLAGCGSPAPPGGNVVANIEADNMVDLPVDETVASTPNGEAPPPPAREDMLDEPNALER